MFKNFKMIIFDICQALNYTVVDLFEADITPNFHVARVKNYNTDLFILCSRDNHWAYSDYFSENEHKLNFTNCKKISELLIKNYNIRPHLGEELNSTFTNKYSNLQNDIKYWKPKIEGEGLFNWWD